jgi:hypothetical protein
MFLVQMEQVAWILGSLDLREPVVSRAEAVAHALLVIRRGEVDVSAGSECGASAA